MTTLPHRQSTPGGCCTGKQASHLLIQELALKAIPPNVYGTSTQRKLESPRLLRKLPDQADAYTMSPAR